MANGDNFNKRESNDTADSLGKNLDTLYIITAHSSLAAEGDIQGEYPHSGDLFKLDFGPNSEIRKLLGGGWKGADKYRFGL
jgi:hypothetical protein